MATGGVGLHEARAIANICAPTRPHPTSRTCVFSLRARLKAYAVRYRERATPQTCGQDICACVVHVSMSMLSMSIKL